MPEISGSKAHFLFRSDRYGYQGKATCQTSSSDLISIIMKLSDVNSMTAPESRKRGRPLSFDREKALEQAMLMFWQYGYEATSVQDLIQAMGITAPSLYTAFGDKEQLFMEAIQYYQQKDGCQVDEIFANAPTAKIAIELYLHENAVKLVQPSKPHGCMIVTAATNCSTQSSHVQAALAQRRQDLKNKIKNRLTRGITDGDIQATQNIEQLADFYSSIAQGMTIQARDGASYTALQAISQMAMAAWPD